MAAAKKRRSSDDIRIVILQRGWVFVGRFSQDGTRCRLDEASCIRVWGTTRGLGELVQGPTGSTKLDPAGEVSFHELTVVATLKCEASKWAQHLKPA